MQPRVLRRAVTTAMAVLLLTAVAAQADTVPADGDAVIPGNQGLIDLGQAGPGQTITWPIRFGLTCSGFSHAAPRATITVELSDAIVPAGASVSATTTTIGPVPADWTPAGEACPAPAPTLPANGPSTVSMTMPTTPGLAEFTLMWSRSGSTGLTGASAMTIRVDVVANTPPALHLPADLSVEATSAAGAAVGWSATATDLEDSPAPTPTCSPASGSTLPLGVTTVQCSVADTGGMEDSGSFVVSVVDTTTPVLASVADIELTTGDPSGTTLTYGQPNAVDKVDPSPSVVCLPGNGSKIPVGTTTVTCTATDASGNHSSTSFNARVTFVPPVAWTARWGEPVAAGTTFVANPGRTIPIKVEIFANGVEQTGGAASLAIATCGGASVGTIALDWDGGRWAGHLDTSRLGSAGCYVATASLAGNVAGSFRIDLRGDAAATSGGGGPKGKSGH
jgi:hypothetical protein